MSNEAPPASEQPQAQEAPSEQPVNPTLAESPGSDPSGLSIEQMVAELPSEVVDAIGKGMDPVEALAQHGPEAGLVASPADEQPPSPTPETAQPEPEPAPEIAPSEEPGASQEPETPVPAAPPGAKRGARIRLDHLNDDDKALVMQANKAVTAGEFSSFQEAYSAQIAAITPPAAPVEAEEPAQTPPEPQAPPEPVVPSTVADIDAQIAENEAAQKEAEEEYDLAKMRELSKQEIQLQLDRRDAIAQARVDEHNRVAEAQEAEVFYAKYDATWEELQASHPVLQDGNSNLYKMVDMMETTLVANANEGDEASLATLQSPDYMKGIVSGALAMLGQAPESTAASVPGALPAKPARPVGALSTPSSPSLDMDPAALIEMIQSGQADGELGLALEAAGMG